jgi:hypothetical protein
VPEHHTMLSISKNPMNIINIISNVNDINKQIKDKE